MFWQTLRNTVLFFVVTFVAETVLGLVFAVLLHSKVKLGGVYKVLVFVPVVLAPAIMAPVFRQLFAADGQLNWVLEHVGLGFLAQPWLAQSGTAMFAVMLITIWEWTGLSFILYFAAMSQIDAETLEAARIDGAGNLRILISIIWPGVRGTTVALAILGAIGSLKTFDVPYLVTFGGPNYATEFLGTFIYRESIPQDNVGYGATLSILCSFLPWSWPSSCRFGAAKKRRSPSVRNTKRMVEDRAPNRLDAPRHPFAFPLVTMVQGSLAGSGWENYVKVIQVPGFILFFRNSAIIAAATIAIVYVVTMMAAYGFSKLHIRSREVYFWLLLACLTLPEVVLLTPLFVTSSAIGSTTRTSPSCCRSQLSRCRSPCCWRGTSSTVCPMSCSRPPRSTARIRCGRSGTSSSRSHAPHRRGHRHLHAVGELERLPVAARLPAGHVDPDGDAHPPVLRRRVHERPDQGPGLRRDHRIPEVVAYLCLQRLFERGLAAGALK